MIVVPEKLLTEAQTDNLRLRASILGAFRALARGDQYQALRVLQEACAPETAAHDNILRSEVA